MLTELSLKNFKAFESLPELKLKPITIFLGPNNSGKSSVLSAPRILTQTVESYDRGVSLLLNGIMGDFGTYKDLVYHNNTAKHLELSFSFKRLDAPKLSGLTGKDELSLNLKYKYRSSLHEIVLKGVELKINGKQLLSTEYSEDSERQIIRSIGGKAIPIPKRSSISQSFEYEKFIPRFIPNMAFRETSGLREKEDDIRLASRVGSYAYRELRSIEYVGAMRVPPSRFYLFSGERRERVGSSGEHAASIIAMDSMRKGTKTKNIRLKVVEWLKKAGIASDLKVVNLSDRYYEIHVKHPDTGEYQNFADVGYGNSQVVPVLVGGFNLFPGDTYIVEEPEIHLHPKAQAELGDFFLGLNQRGIQSLIETHSEHLILRLQQHVAAKLISNSDIAIYYVYAKDGHKKLVRMELDDNARFTKAWPEGFFPEGLEEAKKLAVIRSNSR
jgi:predicted ATPase